MKGKIWLIGTGLVFVVGSIVVWNGMNREEETPAIRMNTTQVMKGPLEVKVSGTGSIAPAARETVKATQNGEVAEVFFQEGDLVKKGDILLTFKDREVSDQIRSKRLELSVSRIDLQDLQDQYKKAEDENARDGIAASMEKQKLQIIEAEESIAELLDEQVVDPVVAPIDGTLMNFDVQAGETLESNPDIAEIVDYANMHIVVGIDELDIPKVGLDQEAQIVVEALPDRTYAGKVIDIANEGTSNNGVASFDVTVLLHDVAGLKAGMSAEASILTNQKEDALFLPIDAVQSFRGEYFVMVPEATKAAVANGERASQAQTPGRVRVEAGLNNEDYIEIVSGVKEGDVVILPNAMASSQTESTNGRQGMGGGIRVPAGGFGGPSGGFGGGRP